MSDPNDTQSTCHRGQHRLPLAIPIAVRERGSHQLPATLLDLSVAGCRIGGVFLSRSSDGEVFVRIPGLEPLPASVRWKDGPAAGLAFARPLHPAVFQRVAALHGSSPAANAPGDHPALRLVAESHRPKPAGNRRDQIVAGYTMPDPGMLLDKRPAEGGKSLMTLVRRNTARRADHRHEPRYAAPEATEVRIGDQSMPLSAANLSESGVMAIGTPHQDIGDTLAVRFADHDPIWATLVWKREGRFGLALPPGSLELDAA